MKTNILLLVIITSTLISCTPTKSIEPHPYYYTYLDENGEDLTFNEFQVRWRDRTKDLVRWDYKKDTGRVAILKEPKYSLYQSNYSAVLKELEARTGRNFFDSTTFLVNYIYLNDLCSKKSTNNWSKKVIRSRKRFTTPDKNQVERKNNIVVLHFFEQGILLNNDSTSAKEYFFLDEDNFLRKNFFKNETYCGSYAIIKPNGETLVRNGEHTAKLMAEHLQPTIWNKIFPD